MLRSLRAGRALGVHNFGKARQPIKPSGEEGRIIAREWACDYHGSISTAAAPPATKQQFLVSVKTLILPEADQQPGRDRALVRTRVWPSAVGSGGTKALGMASAFSRRGRFTNVCGESRRQIGMPCQPTDFAYALVLEDEERKLAARCGLAAALAAISTAGVPLGRWPRAYRGFPRLRKLRRPLRRR